MERKNHFWIWAPIITVLIVVVVCIAIYSARTQSPTVVSVASSTPALPAPIDANAFSNAQYSFYGDTFALANGTSTVIQGHSFSATSTPLIPVSYTLGATTTGDITGSGDTGALAALYRGFGANLEWTTLFAFSNDSTGLHQIASGVIYQGDASIQSVSVSGGLITVNLLVVSQKDMALPHYEQTPTTPLTLELQISGNTFIPATAS